jgi:hypothetical protein
MTTLEMTSRSLRDQRSSRPAALIWRSSRAYRLPPDGSDSTTGDCGCGRIAATSAADVDAADVDMANLLTAVTFGAR